MASKIDKKDEAQFTKEALLKSKSFEKYKDFYVMFINMIFFSE